MRFKVYHQQRWFHYPFIGCSVKHQYTARCYDVNFETIKYIADFNNYYIARGYARKGKPVYLDIMWFPNKYSVQNYTDFIIQMIKFIPSQIIYGVNIYYKNKSGNKRLLSVLHAPSST